MTADARTVDDRIALDGAIAHLLAARGSCTPETQLALDTVLDRLLAVDGLTAFPDEWGVRFVDEDGNTDGPDAGDEYATREPAERVVRRYVDARLVKRSNFRGPWQQVETA